MAFGILEDNKTPAPPGTVPLTERNKGLIVDDPETTNLKTQGNVILQPQPSDSPNDPLNWSMKVKVSIFGTLLVTMAALSGVMSMLGTAGRLLAERFHVEYPVIVQTMGPPGIISTGIALFFCSPIAAVYGKRIQFSMAICTVWLTMIAGIFANSLNYYRNIAIVLGVCLAPYELLLSAITNDIIFVHQRGRLMALSSLISVIGSDAR
jgi:MFS family permease